MIGNTRLWCLSRKWCSLLCFCKAFVWIKYLTVAVFPCHLVHWCGFIGVRISLFFPQNDLRCNVYTTQQSHNVWRQAGVWSSCVVMRGFDWWPDFCYEAKLSYDDCQPDWVYELKSRYRRQTAKLDPDVQIPYTHSAPLGLQKAVV